MDELEQVRAVFENDRFATENGMVIDEIGDHFAKCSVTLTSRHRNALGGVMGGVHFTLADFAFAVASNWQGEQTVALTSDASFIGAVKGERLIAEAKLLKNGRSVCCYQIEVRDELGNLAAAVKTVGFHIGG